MAPVLGQEQADAFNEVLYQVESAAGTDIGTLPRVFEGDDVDVDGGINIVRREEGGAELYYSSILTGSILQVLHIIVNS